MLFVLEITMHSRPRLAYLRGYSYHIMWWHNTWVCNHFMNRGIWPLGPPVLLKIKGPQCWFSAASPVMFTMHSTTPCHPAVQGAAFGLTHLNGVCCSSLYSRKPGCSWAGRNWEVDTTIQQGCFPLILNNSGGPRGRTLTNHKVMAYPSDMPLLYKMVIPLQCVQPSLVRRSLQNDIIYSSD